MRVLFLAGYDNTAYQRKVDLLANAADVELLQLNSSQRLPAGRRNSADGTRAYLVQTVAARNLGHPGDPHRQYYWPPGLAVRRFRPDIIHCEYEQESLGAAQVGLARRLLRPRAALILYSYQNISRPRSVPVRALSAYTLRAANAVLCASTAAATVLRQQGYRGLTPILPAVGVDTRLFRPARPVNPKPTLVIGYAGRLVPEKGLATLLRAAAQARASALARVMIAGSGPARPELEALARALGLADRCTFVGPVEYAEMAAFLGSLDVLVLPSRSTPRWQEQFGRVLVEAMACGVVVVGSASGAIPEVIGEAGLIFPEGDAAALAQALESLAAQPARREALSAHGLQRVQQHYTAERVAAAVLGVWRQLCP